MVLGKALDFDRFALAFLLLTPLKSTYVLEGCSSARIINQAVLTQGAVVDLAHRLDEQHQVFGRVPIVHQHCGEQHLLAGDGMCEHVLHMVKFGLAITIWIEDAVVDDPVVARLGVDVEAVDQANPFDDAVGIATVLAAHQLDLGGEVLVQNRIVKNKIPIGRECYLRTHALENQSGCQSLATQISIQGIVTEMCMMISMVCQREIHLAGQQELAVINACWPHKFLRINFRKYR